MSHITKDNFREVVSEPDWGITWCIRAVMFFLLGFLVLGFYFVPLLFYKDGTIDQEQFLVFGMIYYPLLIVLSYFVVRFLKRRKKKSVRHIKVNCEGIFYELLDGTEESLRFDQLGVSSEDYIVYDVFISSKLRYTGNTTIRQVFLKVFINGKKHKVRDFQPDLGYSYYARNSRTLRSHFLRGIALFRPDLRIDPFIYSEFSIDPDTYEFDKKGYWKAIILATLFVILICIGIDWYMKYRFGTSLFF